MGTRPSSNSTVYIESSPSFPFISSLLPLSCAPPRAASSDHAPPPRLRRRHLLEFPHLGPHPGAAEHDPVLCRARGGATVLSPCHLPQHRPVLLQRPRCSPLHRPEKARRHVLEGGCRAAERDHQRKSCSGLSDAHKVLPVRRDGFHRLALWL